MQRYRNVPSHMVQSTNTRNSLKFDTPESTTDCGVFNIIKILEVGSKHAE